MPPDSSLKHKPFGALRGAMATSSASTAAPPRSLPDKPALGRVVVREEFDTTEKSIITRVIGLPHDQLTTLGKKWREVFGCVVAIEGRDLLVMANESERIAEKLRNIGAAEVALIRRPEVADLSSQGEAGGTERAKIRRGLRVAIVLKADQETGALTEGVVREILTSAPVHPRGIKVRLESGEVGRVKRILGE